MKIFKYKLEFGKVTTVDMPANAYVMSAGIQFNEIVIWASFSNEDEKYIKSRRFIVIPTGVEAESLEGSKADDSRSFVGTAQQITTNPLLPHIVVHVWEVRSTES